jgi:hypothetical protein
MYLAAEGMAADPATVGRWGEITRAVRAAGGGPANGDGWGGR